MKKECSTCAWHDGYTWVCFNGNSEYRADFTDPENTCPAWEERKSKMKKLEPAEIRRLAAIALWWLCVGIVLSNLLSVLLQNLTEWIMSLV
jgi:hypothetical protein